MNSFTKVVGTGLAGGGALLASADANAQETKLSKANKGETVKEVRLTSTELKDLKGMPDITRVSTDRKTDAFSANELAARTRIEANKITSEDTPLAPTIEAIAAEVSEYGLLQTRQEKLDFAKRVQIDVDDNIAKGLKNAGQEAQFFLKGIKWLENAKRDSIFDPKNGYTRERLITALVKSPDFAESLGSLFALSKKETNVPFVTNFNEKLLRESKLASISKSPGENLASLKR